MSALHRRRLRMLNRVQQWARDVERAVHAELRKQLHQHLLYGEPPPKVYPGTFQMSLRPEAKRRMWERVR
jgi:hypothetical protein